MRFRQIVLAAAIVAVGTLGFQAPSASATDCFGTVNTCSNAGTCTGDVNICSNADDCHGIVNYCQGQVSILT